MEQNTAKNGKIMAIVFGFIAGILTMKIMDRKTRRKAARQINEIREEAMRRVKETKDITQEKYNQIIDEIRPRLEAMKDTGAQEAGELISELKSHWKNIAQEAKTQMAGDAKSAQK